MLTKIEEAIQQVEEGQVESGLQSLHDMKSKVNHQEKYLIAESFLRWGLLEDAKEITEELLMLYPDEGQLYILAAEIAIDLDEEEVALEYLNEIEEDDPSYLQALVQIADLYQMQGLDEVAEQKLLEAKRKDSKEPIIDFGLGEFYLSRGDYKKCIPYYQSVLKENEKIGDRNIHLCLAEALSVTGKFEEALEHYEKGLEDKIEIHALFGYGFTAYQLERYQLAISKWNEVKALDPEYMGVYLSLAQAYEYEGINEEAFNTAKEGVKIDEFNKELHLYCGKLGLKMGAKQEAEKYLRDAIALDPGYLEAVLTLTKFLLHEERFEDVIECIEHSNQYSEHDPHFDWDLAKAKAELENYSDALNHYEIAYNAFKDNIEFLEEFGKFLVEEGKRESAIKMFKRLLSIDPSQAQIEEELNRLEGW